MAGLVGCSSPDVAPEFEARRAAALAPAPALTASWDEDGVVRLSPPLVRALLEQSAQAELDALEGLEVSIGSATPTVAVESIELDEGDCEGCIAAKAKLSGDVSLKIGPAKSNVAWEGTLKAQVAFETTAADDGRHIQMSVRSVDTLKIAHDKSRVNLSGPLQTWGTELFSRLEPMDLGAYGGEDLGLLDIRIEPEGGGLDIPFHTDVPSPGDLGATGAAPTQGFVVLVDEQSLVSLAAREAFSAGALEHDLWAEPTSLDVEGRNFELGLRVWRIAEDSWWRDYLVRGDVTVEGYMLGLQATELEAVDSSEGAEAIDALAVLGESVFMDEILEAAQATLPTRSRVTAGSIGMTSQLTDAYGAKGHLVLVGSAEVGPAEKKKVSEGLLKK